MTTIYLKPIILVNIASRLEYTSLGKYITIYNMFIRSNTQFWIWKSWIY